MYWLMPEGDEHNIGFELHKVQIMITPAKERIKNYAPSPTLPFGSLSRDDHLPILLLCREDVCVQL